MQLEPQNRALFPALKVFGGQLQLSQSNQAKPNSEDMCSQTGRKALVNNYT